MTENAYGNPEWKASFCHSQWENQQYNGTAISHNFIIIFSDTEQFEER